MSLTRQFKNGDVVVYIPNQKSMAPVDVRQIPPPELKDTPPVLDWVSPIPRGSWLRVF